MQSMKVLLPVVVFATFLLVPHATFAAETGFFGPIYPEQCVCPVSAPEFGCVLETIRNLINFVLSMGVVIFVLILSYAGFLFMTSSVNAENRNKAKSILMNAVIGLIIALAAWLIVDFVMKVFYNGRFGPWNTILVGDEKENHCIDPITPTITGTPTPTPTPGTGSGGISGTPGTSQPGTSTQPGTTTQPGLGTTNWQSQFSFDPGIRNQIGHTSGPLNSMLSCMAGKLPEGVGRISSISDSRIVSGSSTFETCAENGTCAHVANSCHYGGESCRGSSYAADFGDEQNSTAIRTAALQCGASRAYDEGDHVHVSIRRTECGCNER